MLVCFRECYKMLEAEAEKLILAFRKESSVILGFVSFDLLERKYVRDRMLFDKSVGSLSVSVEILSKLGRVTSRARENWGLITVNSSLSFKVRFRYFFVVEGRLMNPSLFIIICLELSWVIGSSKNIRVEAVLKGAAVIFLLEALGNDAILMRFLDIWVAFRRSLVNSTGELDSLNARALLDFERTLTCVVLVAYFRGEFVRSEGIGVRMLVFTEKVAVVVVNG